IAELYQVTVEQIVETFADKGTTVEGRNLHDIEVMANEPTVINLVNVIISTAVRERASDIHLVPFESALQLRYRIDGLLQEKPHGLFLTTGPTGSGKTTTLYSILSSIYAPEKKILTIEDPVEYELQGVAQTPVRPSRGFTFATGLRSILRQDPDVVMVGEIR